MGCFDFLTRKRKDKKEKERKDAIATRAKRNKISERKPTPGFNRFDVYFDVRPPTPFRGLTPKIGPKLMTAEQRQKLSRSRREAELSQKTHFARQSAIRRAEVLQRKEDADIVAIITEADVAGDVTPREEGRSVLSSSA